MPELPEVETIKQDLEKRILGKKITAVKVNKARVIKEPGLDKFKRTIIGSAPQEIIRRAKVLIIRLDSGRFLIIHLRIAGWILYGKEDPQARVVFRFANGKTLNYMDQRLLGELRLRKDYRDLKFIKELGAEPFELKLKDFKNIVRDKKMKIKALLMDQKFIAGLGNIYVQESLFESGILPTRISSSLSDREISLLHKNMQDVLRKAIRYRGSSVDAYRDTEGSRGGMEERLKVYGRQGKPCFVCGRPVKKISLAGRGTCFCVKCQH